MAKLQLRIVFMETGTKKANGFPFAL